MEVRVASAVKGFSIPAGKEIRETSPNELLVKMI